MEGGRIVIQVQTELNVADNTGAKRVECIKVLGGSKASFDPVAAGSVFIRLCFFSQRLLVDAEVTRWKFYKYVKFSHGNIRSHGTYPSVEGILPLDRRVSTQDSSTP